MIRLCLQCIDLDKFEPFDSEDDLVKSSLHYIENQSLLAGAFSASHPLGSFNLYVEHNATKAVNDNASNQHESDCGPQACNLIIVTGPFSSLATMENMH